MKTPYQEMFDEVHVSERLKEEVMNLTKQERTRVVRKISVSFVIAAALALILAGTALAAVIGVPETLQDWFNQQWTETNGGEVPKEQAAVIESLVQPIGVTVINKGVSVTLDSVTPGEGGLWMLFKVRGTEQMAKNKWDFRSYDLTGKLMENEIKDEFLGLSIRSHTMRNVGVTEDGTQIFLMLYDAPKGVDFLEGGDLEFCLKDIAVWGKSPGAGGTSVSTEVEARWILPFTLAPTENLEVLTVERAVVPIDSDEVKPDSMEIHDIRITAVGISFIEPKWTEGAERRYVTMDVALRLKGGTEIPVNGTGSLGALSPGEPLTRSWELPADLSKAEAIRFGDVVIPLEHPQK